MKGVRLTDVVIKVIRTAFQENFLVNDQLWLFGAYGDLSKRGGDIELYIETALHPSQSMDAKNKFYLQLVNALEDQTINLIVNNGTRHQAIYDSAKAEGIRLV